MFELNETWKRRTDRLTTFIPFIVCYVFSIAIPFVVYAFSGSKNFCINESYENALSTLDYFYYSVVTLTTLGYGDIYPCSDLTKWTVIFQAIAGPALIGLFLVSIANDISERRERQNKYIERRKIFETTQSFFRLAYQPCVEFLDEIGFANQCVRKMDICIASLEDHWSSIPTVHYDKLYVESSAERYLLYLRDHMKPLPVCTTNHIEHLEALRSMYIARLQRVIHSMPKSHVVSECYLPELLSLMKRNDSMKHIADYITKNQDHSSEMPDAIDTYMNEFWLLVVFTLRFMEALNASPAVKIVDPSAESFSHPFKNFDLQQYVNRDWKIKKGISFYRELGKSLLGK